MKLAPGIYLQDECILEALSLLGRQRLGPRKKK